MPTIDIVVPSHLHDKMKRLAELEQETNGFFLYTPQQSQGRTLWLVRSFHMLGIGSAYHVQAHPAFLRAGNAFLQRLRRQSPRAGWEFLKVHTHCRGTGQRWFDKFSTGDHEGIRAELRDNPNFTLMMYSPTRHIAAGRPANKYNIVVVDSTGRHRENSDNLAGLYSQVVREERIELPSIRGTTRSRRL